MKTVNSNILTINAGSSSIKMALYEMNDEPVLKLSGKIENIGTNNSKLVIKENHAKNEVEINALDFHSATLSLIKWLEKQDWFFSGGIGENAPEIRTRICNGFAYLNIQLDEERNNKNEWQISNEESKVKVYVIPTNEELMIAKDTMQLYTSTQNK